LIATGTAEQVVPLWARRHNVGLLFCVDLVVIAGHNHQLIGSLKRVACMTESPQGDKGEEASTPTKD
jgi:hypothetical protein